MEPRTEEPGVTVVVQPGEDAATINTELAAAENAAVVAETAAVVAQTVAEGTVAVAEQQAALARLDAAMTVETLARELQTWQQSQSDRLVTVETSLAATTGMLMALSETVQSLIPPPSPEVPEADPTVIVPDGGGADDHPAVEPPGRKRPYHRTL
jgi:ribosome-binding ATPase YchF (GTP1/OBG family)